jgi:hypothetical protein
VISKAFLLAGAVLVLAGCGTASPARSDPSTGSSITPSPLAVSTPSPTRSPIPSPSPAPTPPILPCNAALMDVAIGYSDSTAGHPVYAVVLTNAGNQTCTLEGYPTLTLNFGTQPIPTTQIDGK